MLYKDTYLIFFLPLEIGFGDLIQERDEEVEDKGTTS